MPAELTCKELIEFLDDYVAQRQSPDVRAAFEAHLSACPACVAYLAQYRASVSSAQSAMRLPPENAPEDLVKAVLKARR